MGSTVLDSRYRIDGLIYTSNQALKNLEIIANACGSWITYDTHEGKWAVVINKAGTSSWSFNDDNIIGTIKLNSSALDKLYNVAKVSYPHEDLKGNTDWNQISIPAGDRTANEYENVLNLDYQVVTNPVQAELLAFIELKQSRVDKIISFTTDYSKIGVKAGDLIDVTSVPFGFAAKVFRVISVSEADGDDGSLQIDITALEYDASVYDEDFTRYIRSDSNGIIPIGSLPAPTKPTVVKTEVAARPLVNLTTTLTGGLVDHVEFWMSPDVTLSDDQRLYTLLKTADPKTAGNVFPLNTAITVEVDSLSTQQFVVKARATNDEGVSLFSLPSDTVNYVPVQVPDAITDSTKIVDNNGGGISGMMTAAALLKLLNGFLKPGGSGLQSLVDTYTATLPVSVVATQMNLMARTSAGGPVGINGWANSAVVGYDLSSSEYLPVSITTTRAYSKLHVILQSIQCNYTYDTKINGSVVNRTHNSYGLWAYIPTTIGIYRAGSLVQSSSSDWQTQNILMILDNAPAGTYEFRIQPLPTYDLNQEDHPQIFFYNFNVLPQGSGGGATITLQGYQ